MKGYIYEATNDVNDKVYIGSTIQRPQQRWNELSPQELAKSAIEIKEFRDGGIGIYTNFVHVDVRGRKARWRG